MKRLLFAIIALASIAFAIFGPFGVLHLMDNYFAVENARIQYENSKRSVDSARYGLRDSQAAFDESRTFEIDYSDIDRLKEVLDNVSTVTVSGITNMDAQQSFASQDAYTGDNTSSAVKISLVVEDTVSALNVLNKMELPIYNIYISEPGLIDITFLTGGGIQ